MQKKWLMGLIGTGAVLGTVIGGSAAMAQAPTTTPSVTAASAQTPLQKFADRVASILGVDSAKVESAIKQARQEQASDAIKQRLQDAVAAGRLTQDQADALVQWYASRPEGIPGPLAGLDHMGGRNMRGFGGPEMDGRGHRHGGPHMNDAQPQSPTSTPLAQ